MGCRMGVEHGYDLATGCAKELVEVLERVTRHCHGPPRSERTGVRHGLSPGDRVAHALEDSVAVCRHSMPSLQSWRKLLGLGSGAWRSWSHPLSTGRTRPAAFQGVRRSSAPPA